MQIIVYTIECIEGSVMFLACYGCNTLEQTKSEWFDYATVQVYGCNDKNGVQ